MFAPIVVADELESDMLVAAAKLPGFVDTFYAITMQQWFAKVALAERLGSLKEILRARNQRYTSR